VVSDIATLPVKQIIEMNQLPQTYRQALKGLQMQADYATTSLIRKTKDNNPLQTAHGLISNNRRAAYKVITAAKERKVKIPNIDEQWLFDWLMQTEDLTLSHLWEQPPYYAACNTINGKEFYFITTYFLDAQACGGHSQRLEDVQMMTKGAVEPMQLITLPEAPTELLNSLEKPEMASHFSSLSN
jgi:hypothetical protein